MDGWTPWGGAPLGLIVAGRHSLMREAVHG